MSAQLQQAADLDYIVTGVIGAVFFAMLFAVGALMMQSIRERVPELAVLKTVGFSDRQVAALILAESITFCVFAAGVGLAIAAALLPLARQAGQDHIDAAHRARSGRRLQRSCSRWLRGPCRLGAACASNRQRAGGRIGELTMGFWKQTAALTTAGLRGLTQRGGAALVTVIGVTTVVGVLVSLLSLGEGAEIFTGKKRATQRGGRARARRARRATERIALGMLYSPCRMRPA